MDNNFKLIPGDDRLTTYPINRHITWAFYEKAEASFWRVQEVKDWLKDQADWNDILDENERKFIKCIIAFFAASDGVVNKNLAERFCNEIPIIEAKYFYQFQMMIENIHARAYSEIINNLKISSEEKFSLFNAIENMPSVRRKAIWALRWIESADLPANIQINESSIKKATFAERLIAFACVEGIFFSGSFCSIYWLAEKNTMPALKQLNEWISRDEGLHTIFACHVFNDLLREDVKPAAERVLEIVTEAVEVEKEFIKEILPYNLKRMNKELMCQYIEHVADDLLVRLNMAPHYNVDCPFDFMEKINNRNKTNFFEKNVTEYQKADIKQLEYNSLNLDEDF
jgi:ribonucleotide reductase beta subunit family protein with ferritin-like domain